MSEARSSWVIQLLQSSQVRYKHQYLPYSTGLLQAYVLRHAQDLSRYTFLPILIDRKGVAETARQIGIADVFGFSTYVWNIEYHLAVAAALKANKPEALTIFGGPQIPDRAEDFLRKYPQVDVCVHGEGEKVFLQLLESLPDKDWSEIPGISYLDQAGNFHHHPAAVRSRELEEFPSPYLMGLFDHFLKNYNYCWVALWETNRGCPFSCTFCDWGSNTASKVNRFGMERLKAEMEWFGKHQIDTINCCDANFGIFARDVEITDYFVDVRKRTGYPKIWFVQGVKNSSERSYQIQKKIIESGMSDLVTLALQSVTPQTLESIRRDNISLKAYRELQERFQRDGVSTYTDMLVGLPGETYDSFANGVAQVIAEGQHHLINFFNVYILPNAELAQPEYRAKHGIQTVRNPYFEPWFPLEVEVTEWQEMIVATKTYTRDEWLKMRVYAWWIEILYLLRKLMQLPLLLTHMLTGLGYREIFEFYAFAPLQNAPLLSELQRFLLNKAIGLRNGETELCVVRNVKDPYWLNVSEFVITGLFPAEISKTFYAEQMQVLPQLLARHGKKLPPGLLEDAVILSEALLNASNWPQPFNLNLRYNLWEVTSDFVRGQPWKLRQGHFRHIHDWVGPPFYQLRVEEGLAPVLQGSSFKSAGHPPAGRL